VMQQTSARSQDSLVLGIGNSLMGDDGAGILAIEMLAGAELPSSVAVEEAGLPGWGLAAWFEGKTRVILVDAVQMGLAPGSWRRFRPDDIQVIMESNALSLHQNDLACGLALSEALGLLPDELLLYGIEPADTSPGAGLSAEVRASLPEVVNSILHDLEKKTE
jgi:hydrogenase maturation protease